MRLSGKHTLKGLGWRGQNYINDLFPQHSNVTILQANCPDEGVAILPVFRQTIESDCNVSLIVNPSEHKHSSY